MIKTSVMKCIKSLLIKTLAARSIFLVSSILFSCMSYGKVINIISLGVKPDSISNNTAIIQSAIDQCHLAGGGRVLVPAGKYITGSLNLKSNVELHLESGAIIIGSIHPADYPQNDIALIFARGRRTFPLPVKEE